MSDIATLRSNPRNLRPAEVSWLAQGDAEDDQPTGRPCDSDEPEFISIPEWARRLGISAESGYKAARLGQIPGSFNIGRLYRVNWPAFVRASSRMHNRNDAD
jgi:hypothetical protein